MAGLLPGDPSNHGVYEVGTCKVSQNKLEEGGGRWYFSRKEIEESSPSRRDGIDLKKETYLRKSYCTFLQDLGMRLKVPQVTIATAIIFCHRFFLCQSHAKNDRRTIATICMFLAGKVEETPRPLKDVILVSYEIIHKKDPVAVQRIKQKEVYEQQKELILLGERVVLATLCFDLNVVHPYKPLVEAIKKFKVAQNALAQVAWNFVNDGLRTSLCLQFKPHHIAAGAIFLAAKFLKVKLPSDGEKVWWQEFDVTPRQLEEVSNQMLELYEQNRVLPSQASEAEGSAGDNEQPSSKAPAANEGNVISYTNPQGSGATSKAGSSRPVSSRPIADKPYADNHVAPVRATQSWSSDLRNSETRDLSDRKGDNEMRGNEHHDQDEFPHHCNTGEAENISRLGSDSYTEEETDKSSGRVEIKDSGEVKGRYLGRVSGHRDAAVGQSPQEAIKKIDKDKVKAALLRRRKLCPDVSRKTDSMDEDLIERVREDGIDLADENEKIKRERKNSWSRSSGRPEHENAYYPKHLDEVANRPFQDLEGQSSCKDINNVEEGEVEPVNNTGLNYQLPKLSNHKRKADSPVEETVEGKQRHDYITGSHNHSLDYITGSHNHSLHDIPEDRGRLGRLGYSERDHKRHVQENHV